MELLPFIFTIVIATAIILATLRYWLSRMESNNKGNDELVTWLKEIGRQVQTTTFQTDRKLNQNMDVFNSRLDKAYSVMSEVQKSIGEFAEIGRSMKDVQDFIASPKLRGNIGEQILSDLLAQHLPQNSYALQFTFKSGEKVDALIKTSQGLIPVDSKFPLENFRKLVNAINDDEKLKIRKEFERDVKKHIQDISRKYILNSEGTVDYALMYIPAESIYYEIVNSPDLYDYAGSARVLPVSPMSFYAYLKAILMSFQGQKIQTQAREILNILHAMQKDYEKADEAISLMNKHVTNAYNQSANVSKIFGSLGQKIQSTHMLSSEIKEEKMLE